MDDSNGLHVFTYEELRRATGDFAAFNKLGEGGFGAVYKGRISTPLGNSRFIAVKKLHPGSHQGEREWLQEIRTLSQKQHPNLVRLLGYCADSFDKLCLVYEFVPLGSLETHLFRRDRNILPWAPRMKVALGSARGLAYLHEEPNSVIHRDLKAPNILLDQDYTPKVADFGLAKYGPIGDQTHISTQVMGTRGYAALEYCMTGHLRTASDVYSFGVVLLELLTGHRAYNEARKEKYLADWAHPYLRDKRRLFDLVDNRLQGRYDPSAAQRLSELIRGCLQSDNKIRPSMVEVVEVLESLQGPSEESHEAVIASGNAQPQSPHRPQSPRVSPGQRMHHFQ